MAYQTKQQQAVLQCLQHRSEECLSAADLSEELRRSGLTVGLATVYRQLDKLAHLEEVCHPLSAEHHFSIDPRRTVLTGICEQCQEEPHEG